MLLVVVVLGVLAGVVMPGLGAIDYHRGKASVDEVKRLLRTARATALASGSPCGVRFRTTGTDRIDLVRKDPISGAVLPLLTPLGVASGTIYLEDGYPGVTITALENGDGSTTDDETIWFAFDGTPHTRDSSGVFVADNTAVCRVTIAWSSTSETVTVTPATGYIEEE